MNAFKAKFPDAQSQVVTFIYASVIRKLNEVSLKHEYETNNDFKVFIRCLPALSHIPVEDVIEAFDFLADSVLAIEQAVVMYFEHTSVRGCRLREHGENYAPPLFSIDI